MAFWSLILNADETIVVISPDLPIRVYVLSETFTVKTAELGSVIKDQACRFISGKGSASRNASSLHVGEVVQKC